MQVTYNQRTFSEQTVCLLSKLIAEDVHALSSLKINVEVLEEQKEIRV